MINEIKPWVFIAGPYTEPYPIYNTRRVMEWWDKLWKTKLIVPIAPHWTMFQDLLFPQPYEEWLKYYSSLLMRCDALFRLEGKSSGADEELEKILKQNKPIFLESQYSSMISWADEWIKRYKDNNLTNKR